MNRISKTLCALLIGCLVLAGCDKIEGDYYVITPESWNRIILIHENWLKNNRHKTISIPAERW